MFMVKYLQYNQEYYICFLQAERIIMSQDDFIAEFIGISYEEYINILQEYGAHCSNMMYNFYHEQEAKKCVDYLNDTYLIALKLQGKT